MATVLCIETATPICSVALGKDGKCIAKKQDASGQNHAKLLTVLIEELFAETSVSLEDIEAVAISQGPGSYTGLRIGTSVAKGICYALDIPLIAVNTLQALANSPTLSPNTLRCPMLDARRMEVYCQLFNENLNSLSEVEAKILDATSFEEILAQQKIAFFGDGADKFQEICTNPKASFYKEILPDAEKMISLAEKDFSKQNFVDVAYFTPFYLKKYQVTVSKKQVF
ncbi:MAG: tRNA (adenosine(37)-N6)-threonylcarbamoyltransferase complex dimerization subunit type 1 TsaB [Flavobacteriaceae bacterium]|nr:tRNA (adenosine(37)-N6)-threonylcarbamoyltransferase complex dimerization subunit type 1 TsaB [Flavobacteriaceae bacterium]